jgi:RNA polymerase sigma-70 factor (ECF subfamily)
LAKVCESVGVQQLAGLKVAAQQACDLLCRDGRCPLVGLNLTDHALMLALAAGHRGALEQLVARLWHSVTGIAFCILGDVHLAEDIAQEAFVRLAAAVAAWGPVREFRRYLDTIVRNLCVDHLRKRTRSDFVGRETESDESILERPTAAAVDFAAKPEDVLDRAPTPEEAAIENERAAAVRNAVESLPENQRRAVELGYFEHWTVQEISANQGISPRAVERRLACGREALRRPLEKSWRK